MSKKNRAQHSTPRRHGDRNVQTRYSGKHQCGENTSVGSIPTPVMVPAVK